MENVFVLIKEIDSYDGRWGGCGNQFYRDVIGVFSSFEKAKDHAKDNLEAVCAWAELGIDENAKFEWVDEDHCYRAASVERSNFAGNEYCDTAITSYIINEMKLQ